MSKCALARGKLAQFTSSLKESPAAEKAGTLIKVGYLGSIKTAERNVFGNLSLGGMEYFAARPAAVALDYLQATMRSAATFGRIKPHEYRQLANNLNIGGLRAGGKGIRQGAHQAVQLMRTGVDPSKFSNAQMSFDLGETNFKSPFLDKVTKTVFNSLEAQDKPFYGFAFQTSLYGRARLMAIREGLTGAKISPRINEILAAPSEEMVLGAHADAQYATFKNETTLSGAATILRQGARRKLAAAGPGSKIGWSVANLAMDITIPFTKVASAITMAGIDYSPAGFLKAIIQAADKDPKIQAQIQRGLARATLGTGLTYLGFKMYENGTITGSPPTDPSDRKVWDAAGKQANSILINGRWRSVTWLGPLAIPMLLGANLRRFSSEKAESTFGEKAAFTVGSIGKTMTEQSYLQGVDRLIGALSDPESKGAAAAAGMVPIPAIVGQAATAIDPKQREAHSVREKVQARIPFASKMLPERLDPFGDPVDKTPGGVRGAAESFVDFTNPRTDKTTGLTEELERLSQGISGVGNSFTVKGKKVQRSPETIRELTREIGPEVRTALSELIVSEEYITADDDEKRKKIQKTMASVKRPVYRRERTGAVEAASSIKAALADIQRQGIR